MKPSEASKKLEFHLKQICHGCMHPSMVGWCENYCQLPEAFKMALSALEKQEQDGWIPVTERLPEEDKGLLVTDEYGEIRHAIYIDWLGKVEFRTIEESITLDDVKAWRPLPEPYTEEEA